MKILAGAAGLLLCATMAPKVDAAPLQLVKLDNAADPQRIDIRFDNEFLPALPGLYFLDNGTISVPLLNLELNLDNQGLSIINLPLALGPLEPYPAVYRLDIIGVLGVGEILPQDLSIPVVFFTTDFPSLRGTVDQSFGLSTLNDTWIRIIEGNVTGFTFDDDNIFLESADGLGNFAGLRLHRPGVAAEVGQFWEVRAQGFLNTDSLGNLTLESRLFQSIPWPSRNARAPIIPTVKMVDQVGEPDESMLVQLTGTFIPSRRGADTFVEGMEYEFSDTTGEIMVLITEASGLDGFPIPTSSITLRGNVYQDASGPPFVGGYKLAPRGSQDLILPAEVGDWHHYH